jgi:hypothetical protein
MKSAGVRSASGVRAPLSPSLPIVRHLFLDYLGPSLLQQLLAIDPHLDPDSNTLLLVATMIPYIAIMMLLGFRN